jgi:hypothetical protein
MILAIILHNQLAIVLANHNIALNQNLIGQLYFS